MSSYTKPPSWFSLESYKANENILSKYSEYLAAQLEYRRLIIAYLELAQDHSNDIPDAVFDAIKNHTFPSDIQVYEALAKFGINRPVGLRYCRLGDIDEPVKELDYRLAYKLREIIPEDDLNKLDIAYSSNSNVADEYTKHSVRPLELAQLESTSFTDRCLEMENKDYLASRLPRRRIFLSIDLDASDEEIRKAFDSKVGKIRKRNHQLGYNKNRTSISLKKEKISSNQDCFLTLISKYFLCWRA